MVIEYRPKERAMYQLDDVLLLFLFNCFSFFDAAGLV
jgi:hypothetical protein